MKVYRLKSDPSRYSDLAFKDDRDAWVYEKFDGSSEMSSWKPFEVVPAEDEEAKVELADFVQLGTIPVFSHRAADNLGPVLLRHGELLPLKCTCGEFFAFNLTVVRDALDETKSELRRFSKGRVMWIDRFAFHGERIGDVELFKIPQKPGSYVFVTADFVARIRATGLTGFWFEDVWSGQ